MTDVAARAVRLLRAVPGIVDVRVVQRPDLEAVADLEERYGRTAFLPVLNLGIRQALERQVVLAVLKGRLFRPPPAPTVYLVEDVDGAGGADPPAGGPEVQGLQVGQRRFRILGEEVLEPGRRYAERTMNLGDSFVVFPERRSRPTKPSYFLIPPLGFRELEEAQGELGVRDVLSVSPSAQADSLLRERCGFPADPGMATLLVAFDCQG